MEKTIDRNDYNFAFLDEGSKREIRRSILHAIAIPGYQVPFGSRGAAHRKRLGNGGHPADHVLDRPSGYVKSN